MPSLDDPYQILSWIFTGAGVIAMLFAVNETKGIPIQAFFTTNEPEIIPKKFLLFTGYFFAFNAMAAFVDGSFYLVAFLTVLAVVQVGQYYRSTINSNNDANQT